MRGIRAVADQRSEFATYAINATGSGNAPTVSATAELHALIAATYGVPQTAPGLLAWIDGACDWEVNRRRGFHYALQPPESAIDPSEDAVSIEASMAMQATFVKDSPAAGTPCSVRWRSSICRVECP